jgi:hypothetical protein
LSDDTEGNIAGDDEETSPLAHFSLKKRRFLEAFAQEGNIKAAALKAGVSRRSHHLWLKGDAEYKTAFEDAFDDFADSMEAEADRRGRDGYDKPVFYKGEACGTVREYSDSLLTLRLRALRPHLYRDPKPAQTPTDADETSNHEAALVEIRQTMADPDFVEFKRQQLVLRDQLGLPADATVLPGDIVRARLADPEYHEFLQWKAQQFKNGDQAGG